MEIRFNVTGDKRKALVGAISREMNATMKYLGAPTFAYEVGGYTIDRNGTLAGGGSVSSASNALLVKALKACGFIGEVTDRGNVENGRRFYQAELYDPEMPDRMELFSADDDEEALRQAFQYTDKNVRLLELHQLDGDCNVLRSVDIPHVPDRLAIEIPLEGFNETALNNLEKLIAGKSSLIKKALGADNLSVERTEEALRFPWFRFEQEPEKVNAYARFIGALCKASKEQKRVTVREKSVENEKYAFRCFLLRLGFIGEEYAAARKILLAGLSGSSAFRNGEHGQRQKH